MRRRWVVISNCQSFGYANSIDCLARDIDCEGVDLWSFGRLIAEDPDHFRRYDLALVIPEALDWPGYDPERMPQVRVLPAFQFPAYHPDSVYVFADGEVFNGGLIHAYHSMVALAAFKEGLDPEYAATFYNATVYQRAGFFNQYDPHRAWLIRHFRDHGLEVGDIFVRRTRGRPLMHTVNHPVIEVLFDIARELLGVLGERTYADVPPPPDNLAPIAWPIYPEVGERLGLRGNYLFKPAERHKPLTLVEFIADSSRRFSAFDRSVLRVIPALEQPLRRIRRHMRDAA